MNYIDEPSMGLHEELRLYAENGINVLFRGKHGVGKTAIVKTIFEELFNDEWCYFSASTMDPWVDFVGVPQKVTLPDGTSAIELVRPTHFQAGKVRAIFMDELNRSKDKIRNAVMELIQFKSINGVPFPNLQVVWAAINPLEDEESDTSYDVEELDPAQEDRFPIWIDMPYQPDIAYFKSKYGDAGVGAVEWWFELTEEQNKSVSPRRLEDAIKIYQIGGNLENILKDESFNLTALRSKLVNGSVIARLKKLFNQDDEKIKDAFSNASFESDALNHIIESPDYINKFSPFLQQENLANLVTENEGENAKIVINNTPANVITPILCTIISASSTKRTVLKTIRTLARQRGLDLSSEENFRQAITTGLGMVSDKSNKRYAALQAVGQVFSDNASLELYIDCVKFIGQIISHTQEASLRDNAKPYNILSANILQNTERELKKHQSSVMEVWKTLRETDFKNADKDPLNTGRNDKIEKYLQIFLTTPI